MRSSRRFPPPWSVEEQEACFVVRDHNKQALSYVYYEEEPGRQAAAERRNRIGAVNPGGSVNPLLESAETAIAFHLVLQWSPSLPQPSVLAPKARRSESRCRGNR